MALIRIWEIANCAKSRIILTSIVKLHKSTNFTSLFYILFLDMAFFFLCSGVPIFTVYLNWNSEADKCKKKTNISLKKGRKANQNFGLL